MHVNFSDNAGCPVELVVNLLAKAGNLREVGSIPGSGRSSGGEHGNPLQYSCLENPTDRGAWWATVHGVAQSQTQWSGLAWHTAWQGRGAVVSDFGITGNWNLSNPSSKGGKLNERNWSSQYPKVGSLDKSQARLVLIRKSTGPALWSPGVPHPLWSLGVSHPLWSPGVPHSLSCSRRGEYHAHQLGLKVRFLGSAPGYITSYHLSLPQFPWL